MFRCYHWTLRVTSDPPALAAFNSFWTNVNGVRDKFIRLWDFLSRRYRHFSNVIGYDLLNEPIGDEKLEILPLYEEIGKIIYKNDPTAILFVSPQISTASGIWWSNSEMPRPKLQNPFCYAVHFYEATSFILGAYVSLPAGPAIWKSFDRMSSFAHDNWKVPLFIGEFGVENHIKSKEALATRLFEGLDNKFLSGAQWVYS